MEATAPFIQHSVKEETELLQSNPAKLEVLQQMRRVAGTSWHGIASPYLPLLPQNVCLTCWISFLSARIYTTVQTGVWIQILGLSTMQAGNNFLGEVPDPEHLQCNCRTFSFHLQVIYVPFPGFTKLHYLYLQSTSGFRPRNLSEHRDRKIQNAGFNGTLGYYYSNFLCKHFN